MECQCDMWTKLVGDGCEACNPRTALELTRAELDDFVAELHQRAMLVCDDDYENEPLPALDLLRAVLDERDRLRAALVGLLACHTESAGWSMSMVANRAEFDAMLERSQERVERAIAAAREALPPNVELSGGPGTPGPSARTQG